MAFAILPQCITNSSELPMLRMAESSLRSFIHSSVFHRLCWGKVKMKSAKEKKEVIDWMHFFPLFWQVTYVRMQVDDCYFIFLQNWNTLSSIQFQMCLWVSVFSFSSVLFSAEWMVRHLGARIFPSMVPMSSCDKFCDLMAITVSHESIISASSGSSQID